MGKVITVKDDFQSGITFPLVALDKIPSIYLRFVFVAACPWGGAHFHIARHEIIAGVLWEF